MESKKWTFTSKTEADAYGLNVLERRSATCINLGIKRQSSGDHSQKESTVHVPAENKESLLDVLGTKKKAPQKS